ncbi:ATP-dependent DNA helicase [Microbacterium thalli]|uniref:DNA 3'-5' helicase n=1 Tax=Microbacterium thalli TaxID=3027921 RepID=A0ABT5SJD3_9MICO|nr:ATP-dependent DNA helicase [Microbacterium thalli]MDD7962919.1 ATP-dependent DNA helicase [Microbacterium thalli]
MIVSPAALAAALGQFPPTPEQSAVISAPLEPALVVAGAGSGKTETMAGRVVWLVANGLVSRAGILGLTFTRKAAGELAERIRRRLDRLTEFETAGLLPHLDDLHARGALDVFGELERAHAPAIARLTTIDRLADDCGALGQAAPADSLLDRPTVSTYNSFADGIVRENAVRIGRDPEAAVLSESAAWLLMRRVVLESDDERLELRDNALRTLIDGALRIARDGVDNLVDFSDLGRFGHAFADVLERPSTRSGTTVYADVARAVEQVGALPLLADLAREYQARKVRAGVIDFSDQVAGAVAVIRGHQAVADELRARHPVVLLDEYQDTSVVQTELLAAVFSGTAVMAVGDPHQSIYGWRGASAGNLGDFAAAFAPDGPSHRFSLATSWRNSRRILRAANAVLTPLAERSPVPVDELRSRPGAPEGQVDIVFEPDLDAETDRVAAWFQSVRADRARRGEPTSAAILLRSKKHMTRYADALGRRGIPHRILGLGGLLSTPEVVDVVSALRVISDPTAGSALLRLLAGPRWAVGLRDLRALAELARRLARSDASLQPLPPDLRGGEERASLIDALDFILRVPADHSWLAELTPAARERLREAAAVFAGLRRASTMPVPELVRLIEAELRLDIELAANESRGPARVASDQLRAFVDELQGFLATDESGSLPSLLAWLDHAERQDEFAPRTEPPEDDVVQILTIHGSKGLEWDAVAVGRVVVDELPARPRDKQGWLGFGVLPYAFRGDARWLPEFAWQAHAAPTQQDLKAALTRFADDNADRQREEERRLAYVAVTRARDALLLSGSFWSGTRNPRGPSAFLTEIAAALDHPIDDVDPGENPYLERRQLLSWPLDALGSRRTRVDAAAEAVRVVRASGAVPEPSRDLALLLAERDERRNAAAPSAPTRIPASRFKEFAADYATAVEAALRPLPERPYRETRLGTRFHAWVEQRSGIAARGPQPDAPLWETDADLDETGAAGAGSDAEFRLLQENFLHSEWADLQPIEVETEIEFADATLLGDGRPHVIICKLDAVYRRHDRGGRLEIVDWKTGRPPRTPAERAERMLQLELYRRAYSTRHGVPESEIDVALYYVGDDLILRG